MILRAFAFMISENPSLSEANFNFFDDNFKSLEKLLEKRSAMRVHSLYQFHRSDIYMWVDSQKPSVLLVIQEYIYRNVNLSVPHGRRPDDSSTILTSKAYQTI